MGFRRCTRPCRAAHAAFAVVLLLSGCAYFPRRSALESIPPSESSIEPQTAEPMPPRQRRPMRPPRGQVTEAEKPEWMRGLAMPALPLRWYPRVTQWLELYKNDARSREIVRGWLRRLPAYRPAMEAALEREGLPKGLVFVAMIESGFSASALSSKGAGGFWQFRPDVARGYGLEVSFWVDERRDLEKSTAAAARYLGDLHHRFGNWELALAGYNAGVFAVLDSIVRYNTNDYWTLCSVEAGLPWESTEYVPKVLAVGIVDANRKVFGFDDVPDERAQEWDTVIAPPATGFDTLATRAGVSADELAQWNPAFVRHRTPPDRPGIRLRVPAGRGPQIARAFAAIRPAPDLARTVVRKGETLTRFARARRISVARLRRLNAVSDDREVTPGTTLLVPRGRK